MGNERPDSMAPIGICGGAIELRGMGTLMGVSLRGLL